MTTNMNKSLFLFFWISIGVCMGIIVLCVDDEILCDESSLCLGIIGLYEIICDESSSQCDDFLRRNSFDDGILSKESLI